MNKNALKSLRNIQSKYTETLMDALPDRSINGSTEETVFLPRCYAQVYDFKEPISDDLQLLRGEKIGTVYPIQFTSMNAKVMLKKISLLPQEY